MTDFLEQALIDFITREFPKVDISEIKFLTYCDDSVYASVMGLQFPTRVALNYEDGDDFFFNCNNCLVLKKKKNTGAKKRK